MEATARVTGVNESWLNASYQCTMGIDVSEYSYRDFWKRKLTKTFEWLS